MKIELCEFPFFGIYMERDEGGNTKLLVRYCEV